MPLATEYTSHGSQVTGGHLHPIVVGICGAKFHGKDTAAAVLIERHGFVKVAFADGLKQCMAHVLRTPIQYFEDPALKETIHEPSGKTYRQWLQVAGTDWFRTLWTDVWVNWWSNEIVEKCHNKIVVTDLRFPNELEAVRRFDRNTVIRIVNPNVAPSGDSHASEMHQAAFAVDKEILNNGTIDRLQLCVEDEVFRQLPALYFG